MGHCFVSLDGLSYREIVDQSEIEVVSVDPHGEWSSSSEKKRGRKVRRIYIMKTLKNRNDIVDIISLISFADDNHGISKE